MVLDNDVGSRVQNAFTQTQVRRLKQNKTQQNIIIKSRYHLILCILTLSRPRFLNLKMDGWGGGRGGGVPPSVTSLILG